MLVSSKHTQMKYIYYIVMVQYEVNQLVDKIFRFMYDDN